MKENKGAILLVDDDHDVVWGVGKILARAGYYVATCGDGQEAIKLLQGKRYDVLITDIRMPLVNGLALVDWARQNCSWLRVVVMTAFGSPSIRQLALSKGALLYLEKPVDPDILVEVLSSNSQDGAFSGSIDQIDILDYLQLVLLTGRQVVLDVTSRQGDRGLIFVENGKITHAELGDLQGEEALYRCLAFQGGSFANLPWRAPNGESIKKPGEFLLIEAARYRDEIRHVRSNA